MGNPVAGKCLDDRIATDNLTIRIGSRVAVVGCFDIGGQYLAQFWQPSDELAGNRLCLFGEFARLHRLGSLETEACQNLLREQVAKAVQADADVIGECFTTEEGLAVEAGEQDGTAKVDNFSQCRG